jgi:hypothetical protein
LYVLGYQCKAHADQLSMPDRTQSYVRSGLPTGEGTQILGTYVPGKSLHHEDIDPSFHVRAVDFYFEGRVFAIMWDETTSTTWNPTAYNTSPSLHQIPFQGNTAYVSIRRFVVVRSKHEFCYVCPIFMYSGRGTDRIRLGDSCSSVTCQLERGEREPKASTTHHFR